MLLLERANEYAQIKKILDCSHSPDCNQHRDCCRVYVSCKIDQYTLPNVGHIRIWCKDKSPAFCCKQWNKKRSCSNNCKNWETAAAALRFQLRNQHRRSTKKSRIQIIAGGATVFRGGFYFIGIYRHLLWGGSRSLFGFLCVQRCFPEKRHSSARSHCQQPFWAWETISEELKYPPANSLFVNVGSHLCGVFLLSVNVVFS